MRTFGIPCWQLGKPGANMCVVQMNKFASGDVRIFDDARVYIVCGKMKPRLYCNARIRSCELYLTRRSSSSGCEFLISLVSAWSLLQVGI